MRQQDGHDNRQNMKDLIFDALMALLEQKSYLEVSIADICNQAFMSRPTFYRYFQNKDNVVRWKTKQIFKCSFGQVGRTINWKQANQIALTLLYQYRKLYADPQNPAFIQAMFDYACDYQADLIAETLTRYRGIAIDEKLHFEIEAFSVVSGRMTRRWFEEGMHVDPAVLADYMTSIIPHDLYVILNEIPQSDK